MYRKCVAIVIYDSINKLCLVGERSDKSGAWQFPQGGVDAGESFIEAAKRELFEEFGIKAQENYQRNFNYDLCKIDVSVNCVADINQAEINFKQNYSENFNYGCVEFKEVVGPFRYDYPQYVKRDEKGQEQMWFLAKTTKPIIPIKLNYEFSRAQWFPVGKIVDEIVDFKKEVYVNALSCLGLI